MWGPAMAKSSFLTGFFIVLYDIIAIDGFSLVDGVGLVYDRDVIVGLRDFDGLARMSNLLYCGGICFERFLYSPSFA